jgi:transposase, IS5 family
MKPKQSALSMMGFDRFAKTTRRAAFLAQMEEVAPWKELCAVVEAHYPRGARRRPPVGLERMLRIYFLQQWFSLSDAGVEEAVYDSAAMRGFVSIGLGREPVPDETTVCKFRHLLEKHKLGESLFEQVHRHLEAQGIRTSRGTIVDFTTIDAPSSTKNATQDRGPYMHQTCWRRETGDPPCRPQADPGLFTLAVPPTC